MTSNRLSRTAVEVVTLATQDERERLAMVIMQLEMALALARENDLFDVETCLKAALAEAESVNSSLLN
jgi:hypothetical protein